MKVVLLIKFLTHVFSRLNMRVGYFCIRIFFINGFSKLQKVDFEEFFLVSLPIGLILGSCQVYKNWHIDVIRCLWITIDLLLSTPWKMWLQLSRNWPCWHFILWLDNKLGPHPLFLHAKARREKNDDVWFTISPISCNQFQLIIDD